MKKDVSTGRKNMKQDNQQIENQRYPGFYYVGLEITDYDSQRRKREGKWTISESQLIFIYSRDPRLEKKLPLKRCSN